MDNRSLRNEQFFSLPELNAAIKKKLEEFSHKPFQKKEGSRYEIFRDEELPLLAKLPDAHYELAEWKTATVQFNYHISVDGMLYSVPYEYIRRKVDVRVTETTIEIFYNKTALPPTVAYAAARDSTVPSRSICRKTTRSIWSGMATVSAAGLHGSVIIQTRL